MALLKTWPIKESLLTNSKWRCLSGFLETLKNGRVQLHHISFCFLCLHVNWFACLAALDAEVILQKMLMFCQTCCVRENCFRNWQTQYQMNCNPHYGCSYSLGNIWVHWCFTIWGPLPGAWKESWHQSSMISQSAWKTRLQPSLYSLQTLWWLRKHC